MSARRHLRVLIPLAALMAVLAVGCSGDDESDEQKASTAPETAPETAPAEKPKRRPRSERGKAAGGKKGRTAKKRVSKAELEKERRARAREAAQDRREDRKFDKAFSETAFERIVAQLPVRKAPLFVEQYITSQGSSTVYTAVDPKRFFCGRSTARRKAAVTAFHRDADKLFRRKGVKNFAQVVTPLAETAESLPALATARGGTVKLTKRGRGKGPC